MAKGVVYFIQEGYDNSFKIGLTRNEANYRKKSLQTGNSTPLRVFGKIETTDTKKLEDELHERFDISRERGEWFVVDPRAIFNVIDEYGGEICVDDPFRVKIGFDKEAYRKEIENKLKSNLDAEYNKKIDALRKTYEVKRDVKKIFQAIGKILYGATKAGIALSLVLGVGWVYFMAMEKHETSKAIEVARKAREDSLATAKDNAIKDKWLHESQDRLADAMVYLDSLRALRYVNPSTMLNAELRLLAADRRHDIEVDSRYRPYSDGELCEYELLLEDSSYCAGELQIWKKFKKSTNGVGAFMANGGQLRIDILSLRIIKLSEGIRAIEQDHPGFWLKSKYHQ